MLHKTLLTYVFFILSIIFVNFMLVLRIPNVLGYATDIKVDELLFYTNELREKNGLNVLALNDSLSKAAAAKAVDMFKNDYWAHTSPSGKEPWDFIIGAGYDYIYAGENLAVDFSKSKDVVIAWDNSPSHRDNLLSHKYSEIGFAVVNGELQGRKTTLVVQMFGNKRSETKLATLPASTNNNRFSDVKPDIVIDDTLLQVDAISSGAVLSSSTVMNASKYISLILGLFISILISADWLYTKKSGNIRISGHTVFHVLLLLFAVFCIWYTSIGLVL